MKKIPLKDVGVLVTRTRSQAWGMVRKIEELGGKPYHIPAITIEEVSEPEGLKEALLKIGTYHGLIFTSANGVRIFADHLERARIDISEVPSALCVGDGTGEAWTVLGGKVALVPERFTGEALAGAIAESEPAGKAYLLLRPEVAATDLGAIVRKHGANVDDIVLYRTISDLSAENELRKLLDQKAIQVITLASPSAMNGLTEILGGVDLVKTIPCLCIGPKTARSAMDAGMEDIKYPDSYTIEGMLQMLIPMIRAGGERR